MFEEVNYRAFTFFLVPRQRKSKCITGQVVFVVVIFYRGTSMKETPRRRKMVRSSLNEMSTDQPGNRGVGQTRGLQWDIVYLGWPIAPSNVSPNRGEGGSCGVSANVYSCTVHRSPNKLRRSNSIFNLWGRYCHITPLTEKGRRARRRVYRYSSPAIFAGAVGPYSTGPCRLYDKVNKT